MTYMTVVPAHGRDYKSAKAALADWHANKDFIIRSVMSPDDGRYINKQDAAGMEGVKINIRYNRLTRIVAAN